MRGFKKKAVSITVDVSYWELIMLRSLLKLLFFLRGGRGGEGYFFKIPVNCV